MSSGTPSARSCSTSCSISSRKCFGCMRRINLFLLWVFVFTTPWDAVPLPLVGSLSRVAGVILLGMTVVAVLIEGRVRKPDWVFGSLIAFTAWLVLSLLWTISYGDTLTRVWTTVQ